MLLLKLLPWLITLNQAKNQEFICVIIKSLQNLALASLLISPHKYSRNLASTETKFFHFVLSILQTIYADKYWDS